jgi:hypothetical protein
MFENHGAHGERHPDHTRKSASALTRALKHPGMRVAKPAPEFGRFDGVGG